MEEHVGHVGQPTGLSPSPCPFLQRGLMNALETPGCRNAGQQMKERTNSGGFGAGGGGRGGGGCGGGVPAEITILLVS